MNMSLPIANNTGYILKNDFLISFSFIVILSILCLELNNVNATEPSGFIDLSPIVPRDITFNIVNNEITAISSTNPHIWIIDAKTNDIIHENANLTFTPFALAIPPGRSGIFILGQEQGGNTTNIYGYNNQGQISFTLPLPTKARSMAVNLDNEKLYVTLLNNNILVIDTQTNPPQIITQISSSERGSNKIIFNPYDKNMYVLNSDSETVSVIYTKYNVVTDIIKLGDELKDIAFNPINNMVYVTSSEPEISFVYIIDSNTRTMTDKMAIGGTEPRLVIFNPVDKNMYVFGRELASAIDSVTNTITDIVPTGFDTGTIITGGIVFNPLNKSMYFAIDEPASIFFKRYDSNTSDQ